MKILLLISFVSTFIALLSLTTGFVINLKKEVLPKNKALVGVIIGISLAVYLITLSASVLYGLFKQNYILLSFLFFIIIPFIIGHYASYEKRKLYTIFQLFSYLVNLLFIIYIYIFC